MSEISMKVMEIDGTDYMLVEIVDKYNFFVEENNIENICVLKTIEEDGETFFVNLDDSDEVDEAFSLYYEKLKSTN